MSHHENNDKKYPTEKACRTLFVRNVNYGATEEEIRDSFEKYGKVKQIFSRISTRGMVFVTYSDLRDAENAMKNLQRTNIRGRPIDIHYSLPREEDDKYAEPNKYLKDSLFITLTETENELSVEDARQLFARFGDIKDIREWSKKDQKIVEFFDTDECDKAKDDMEGKAFKGGILSIEYALAPKNNNQSQRSHVGPQRRSRNRDRDRDRNHDKPYHRSPRSDRSNMNFRPERSGVNHMINDLASALQQQAQRFTPAHSVNNDYSPQYPQNEYGIPPVDYQQGYNSSYYPNSYGQNQIQPPMSSYGYQSHPEQYGMPPMNDPRNYVSYRNENINDMPQYSIDQRYSQIPQQQYYDRSPIQQNYSYSNHQEDLQYDNRYIDQINRQQGGISYDYNQQQLRPRNVHQYQNR